MAGPQASGQRRARRSWDAGRMTYLESGLAMAAGGQFNGRLSVAGREAAGRRQTVRVECLMAPERKLALWPTAGGASVEVRCCGRFRTFWTAVHYVSNAEEPESTRLFMPWGRPHPLSIYELPLTTRPSLAALCNSLDRARAHGSGKELLSGDRVGSQRSREAGGAPAWGWDGLVRWADCGSLGPDFVRRRVDRPVRLHNLGARHA